MNNQTQRENDCQEDIPFVLIVGDLTVDLLTHATDAFPLSHRVGSDVTFVAPTTTTIGGTATLFARAVASETNCRPIILSAVGRDTFGQQIIDRLEHSEMSVAGIQEVLDIGTGCPSTAYFTDGTRLMVRPADFASRHLSPEWTEHLLTTLEATRCALVFISGYAIVNGDSPSCQSAAAVSGWAAANSVPCVLDLVPHDFINHVGSLGTIKERLHTDVSGFIAEHKTVRNLGLGTLAPDFAEPSGLVDAATALGRVAPIAIVQQQLTPSLYGQAYQIRDRRFPTESHAFRPTERSGLGDLLAVRALVRSGLLGSSDVT